MPTRMTDVTRPTWETSQCACVSVVRVGPMAPKPSPQTSWPTHAHAMDPVPTYSMDPSPVTRSIADSAVMSSRRCGIRSTASDPSVPPTPEMAESQPIHWAPARSTSR